MKPNNIKAADIKTEVWDNLWEFGQRTDIAMALAGAFAGFLIGGELVDSLLRDPDSSSNLKAGFSQAGWLLKAWNPVMGGIIAYAIQGFAFIGDRIIDCRTDQTLCAFLRHGFYAYARRFRETDFCVLLGKILF